MEMMNKVDYKNNSHIIHGDWRNYVESKGLLFMVYGADSLTYMKRSRPIASSYTILSYKILVLHSYCYMFT